MIDLIPIGKLGKSQGVNGHLRTILTRKVDLSEVKAIFVNVRGDKIPYFVDSIEDNSVKFDEINNPEDARYLTGFEILLNRDDFEETIEESDQLSTFVGFMLHNDDQEIGRIDDVVEYPQQIMAIVKYEDEDILIPLVEEYILDIDSEQKKIYCELPDGFIEAQLEA